MKTVEWLGGPNDGATFTLPYRQDHIDAPIVPRSVYGDPTITDPYMPRWRVPVVKLSRGRYVADWSQRVKV